MMSSEARRRNSKSSQRAAGSSLLSCQALARYSLISTVGFSIVAKPIGPPAEFEDAASADFTTTATLGLFGGVSCAVAMSVQANRNPQMFSNPIRRNHV